ncbi:cell division protein FtsQ/DivIB [Leadbetterella sp. DM7]|uniref:cell division protein FtsQ/DivIB n=1 Tax=Leadbetterella sp. DM7 TaxID=3235085 RepID=UPI00349E86DF
MKKPDFKTVFHTIGGVALAALALFLVFSSAKSDAARRCEGLIIRIQEDDRQLLVKKADVEKWATREGTEPLTGQSLASIDLKKLERRVENSGIIRDCQAYVDLKGKLILDVQVYKPIARILGDGGFPDRYMDEKGHFFPVSKNFTPTVLLLSGYYFRDKKGLESAQNQDLLKLVNTITGDEFWNAQITRMDVDRYKEIQMEPLLGENIIEFGRPEKIQTKLEKLLVFYKKILPREQWSSFSHVSVKYDGQIVCK